MVKYYIGLIIFCFFIITSLVLIFGTIRGWQCFVNPSEKSLTYYPYKRLGKAALLSNTRSIALVFIMLGLTGIIIVIERLAR
jgi:hypothetical protein